MAASISDVAARAGVSVATVSRALRGLPNVAPSTRQRVVDAAQELRYIADPHAARLAAGRSRTVGMVVPLLSPWYFTQVVAGGEAVLAEAGYDVLLYSVGGAEARKRFLEGQPFRRRVDGLVLVDLPLAEDEAAHLAETATPVVTVGTRTPHFPAVVIDDEAAGATATRHLLNLGHVHIGLLSFLEDDPFHFTAPRDRRAGYRRALHDAGIEPRADLEAPGNFSLKGGAEAMAQLLTITEPPTAVFAQSDEMAIGALKILADLGLRVPGDLSVIGFDDHDMAFYWGLTTMAQDVGSQGEIAANLLLDAIDGAPVRGSVELSTKLLVRSTTGPRSPSTHRSPSTGAPTGTLAMRGDGLWNAPTMKRP